MSNEHKDQVEPCEGFCNEATRQRWEWFHRAIAHAKQCNVSALQAESGIEDDTARAPLQSVAR